MLDKNKVKEFVEEHEGDIALGAIVAATVVMTAVGLKKADTFYKTGIIKHGKYVYKKLEKPEIEIGTIRELWEDHKGITTIIDGVKVADMGKLGEDLCKIKGVTPDTVVNSAIGFIE